MTEAFSAAADIATGSLLARAVEPEAGEGRASQGGACRNCQTMMIGNHCHHCGQKATLHRTLSAFGHDILHSVLHFDGKIWRTLPLLVWHPGALTRRYVHGERAKFVSPIALFLFFVFLTFSVFNAVVPSTEGLSSGKAETAADAAKSLVEDRAEMVADIKDLENERKEAASNGDNVGGLDAQIKRSRAALNVFDQKTAPEIRQRAITEQKRALQKHAAEAKIAALVSEQQAAARGGTQTAALEAEIASARRALNLAETEADALTKEKSGNTQFSMFGIDALNKATEHAVENPQLLIYKIQSNAYKYSWALIPISVPFVWLLFFWRREFKLFDHAVFITYSLCFMMALGAIGSLILTLSTEGSFAFVVTLCLLIIVPPLHMYRHVHHSYQTSRFGAIWRTCALLNFAVIALGLFASLILTLGVTH
jgi:hypothetical protein